MSKGTTGFIAFLVGGIIVTIIGSDTAIVNIIIIAACIFIGLYIRSQIISANEELEQLAQEQKKAAWKEEKRKRDMQELTMLITKYPNAIKYFIKQYSCSSYISSNISNMSDEQILAILQHKYEFESKERELNPEYKRRKELQEAEFKRIQEQQALARKIRENQILEEKIRAQEIERKKKEKEIQELPYTLPSCVSSWPVKGSIRHIYYYDYYPYYRYKDSATTDMWNTWHFIWGFKNDPAKGITQTAHALALNSAISLVKKTLSETFGNRVQYLTFVCLTASTQQKTDLRFKDFSKKLCESLKMTNAYGHIRITSDGSAKHEGGCGVSQKTYDQNFFKGKFVVLFDDVRTSGNSLESEKNILEKYGAKVICAITLGQTV